MQIEIKSLPPEIWTDIIDRLDLQDLIVVSSVNRMINEIAKGKLQLLKSYFHCGLEEDIEKFLDLFNNLQEAYVIRYHYNSLPSRDVQEIGKYILFEYSPCFKNLEFKKNPPPLLKSNQILITPHFSKIIQGAITIENNPLEDYLKIELEKDERLIVEDRMVICRISYKYTSLDPCRTIALRRAFSKMNKDWDASNESMVTFICKSTSNFFSNCKGFLGLNEL